MIGVSLICRVNTINTTSGRFLDVVGSCMTRTSPDAVTGSGRTWDDNDIEFMGTKLVSRDSGLFALSVTGSAVMVSMGTM
jgi:hypothetical protein